MKTKNRFLSILLTLALVLGLLPWSVLPVRAAADLTISNTTEWNAFANNVGSGTSYSGQTVVLAADIEVSTMVGDASHKFAGTFNGGGHTLTFKATATADDCAPFGYIDGATVKSLNVAGAISTGYKYAAGIAAHSYGDCAIQNCRSSVAITSTVSGDGTHAGFVAVEENGGTLTVTDCLFDGSITGSNTTKCGGFVGWRNGTLTFNNCLMAGTMTLSSTSGSATFNRNGSATLNNCYYKTAYGDVQGTQTSATGSDLQALLGSGWEVSGGSAVPVTDPKSLSLATVSGVKAVYSYTGEAIDVAYTVTAADGTVLEKGTHYTETFDPATVQDTGDYTLTITGKSPYSGSQTFRFTVADGTSVTPETTKMTTGVYNVTQNVTITERIIVTGAVELNLGADCTLTAEKGITVGKGNSLTITGTGTLNADMSKDGTVAPEGQPNAAAIGGGIVTKWDGDDRVNAKYGTITINGGHVYAKSANGAGIGCSFVLRDDAVEGSGGTININGGSVTAISTLDIGSLYCAAGIGGCVKSECGTINISGGTVVAEAYGSFPAAIGCGGLQGIDETRGGGVINISGGQVTAKVGATGIGFGAGDSTILKSHGAVSVNLNWTDPLDFIDVKSISARTLTFAKPFRADGEGSTEQAAAGFAGKKMVPAAHVVTFDAGASSSTYNHWGVADNGVVSAPADPTPPDTSTVFAGWTLNGEPYDFSTPVTGDLTLTAAYKLDFIVNGLQHLYAHNGGSAIDLGFSFKNSAGVDLTASEVGVEIKNSEGNTVTSVTDNGVYTLTATGKDTYSGIVKTLRFAVADAVAELGEYRFINLGTDVYGISLPELLEDFSAYVNKGNSCAGLTFRLTGDITFDAAQANNHTPIGSGRAFGGTFDGQGHTIRGIRVQSKGQCQGLFGTTDNDAVIQGVKLADAEIVCGSYSGALVGKNIGTVTDCVVGSDVAVKASRNNLLYLGGVVGQNNGVVSGCLSAASIRSNGYGNIGDCGGIVGVNRHELRDSVYTGDTRKDPYISFGFLVGFEQGGVSASIDNCYFTNSSFANTLGICRDGTNGGKYTTYGSGYAYTVSGAEGAAVAFSGTPTQYATSGIDAYAPGVKMGGKLYGTKHETIRLTLSHDNVPEGYAFVGYAADCRDDLKDSDVYLTDHNVVVKAVWQRLPSLQDGKVTAPANSLLVCATYKNGQMTGVQTVEIKTECVNKPLADILGSKTPAAGTAYKLFLLGGETCAPLCAAWDSATSPD